MRALSTIGSAIFQHQHGKETEWLMLIDTQFHRYETGEIIWGEFLANVTQILRDHVKK